MAPPRSGELAYNMFPLQERAPAGSSKLICPICDEISFSYLFVVHGLPIAACRACGQIVLGILPQTPDFSEYYRQTPAPPAAHSTPADSETERDASVRYIEALAARGVTSGNVLLLSSPERRKSTEAFRAEAKQKGLLVDCVEFGELAASPAGPYDAAVVLHCLQVAESPGAVLGEIHSRLRPAAPLLLTVPDVESWPAGFFRQQWTEWKPENRFYFDRRKIQLLLLRYGFSNVLARSDRRLYTLDHVQERASASRRTLFTRAISAVHGMAPGFARRTRFRIRTSGMIVTAVVAEPRVKRKCTIVVPAFNESNSFPKLMDALIEKQLPGIDREIIVVESNSTDGTRELAKRYASHPDVKLILEDRPRGKGRAVREGFHHATGDILLIQDADLEYDLNDYDSLLAPIAANRCLFVLGTRHGGNWKMRKFQGQEGISTFLNLGHLFFTGVINVLYGQRMTDPFTMFKVFHRDCLYGIDLECNRFDFDHELVIKLVRKGYTPLEIPVNYYSRSFREGKKVRMFRDPVGWLWIDLKLRFQRALPKDLR
jgi:hypothetical protein